MTDDVRALDRCVCEVMQLEGAERTICQKETTPKVALNGWCYVDPNQDGDASECSMVEKCQPTDRRILRHMGAHREGRWSSCAGEDVRGQRRKRWWRHLCREQPLVRELTIAAVIKGSRSGGWFRR